MFGSDLYAADWFSADYPPSSIILGWSVAALTATLKSVISILPFNVSADNKAENGTQCRNNDNTNVECRLMISVAFYMRNDSIIQNKNSSLKHN